MRKLGRKSATGGRHGWRVPRLRASTLGAAALLAATALLSAPFVTPVAAQQGQQQQGDVTVDELLSNPSQYYGRRVAILAHVGRVLGPRSISLMDDDMVFGDDVPAIARRPITDKQGRPVDLAQWADRDVRVVGTVHQFNLRAFEDQLGVDLDDDAWAEYAGDPAIVATSVTPITPGQQGGQQGQGWRNATIDAILARPRQYYGQQVRITGEVGAMLGPRSFVMLAGAMAPGAEGLVPGAETTAVGEIPVVGARPLVGPDGRPLGPSDLMDRVARVTGTVHQFNLRAFEDRLGVDLDDRQWAEFAGRPAIIATRVEPVLREQARSSQQRGVAGAASQQGRAQPSQDREQQARQGQAGQQVARQSPRGAPSIDAILDTPRQFYGRQVADVGDVGDLRSFTATYDAPVLGQELPVVSAQPFTGQRGRTVDLNEWSTRQVHITGAVHQFNLAAFEEQLGIDLDDAAWAEFAGRPAIIATRVSPPPESGQGTPDGGSQTGQPRRPRE